MQFVIITENNYLDIKKNSKLQTDATHKALSPFVEFASRVLKIHEIKYSTHNLDFLEVVWATEHF